MHLTVKNLLKIEENVKKNLLKKNTQIKYPKIIAVSKTFKIEHILPLIEHGHIHYGENKVQEALEKWSKIKKQNKNLKLHLIGRLQTNKVKIAIKLFDYIHSLDSQKLANKISNLQKELDLKTKLFIQVNIGNERQKSGISVDEVLDFYNYCKSLELDILGLMCIPPFNKDSEFYFEKLRKLCDSLNLQDASMGMSDDFKVAIKHRATFIRIGSGIFGSRVNK